MKKTLQIILSVLLIVFVCSSLVACKEESEGENAKTLMTLELFTKDSEDDLLSADDLGDVEEYFAVTGYSFSTEDAEIVANAAKDAHYYDDLYFGTKGDGYEAEKARYEQLKAFKLPTSIKVRSGANNNLSIDMAEHSVDANGVIDLTDGETEAVETIPVLALGESALLNHTEIQSLVIPDTYLAIGTGALSGCSSLKELSIPFVGQKVGAVNGAKVFGHIFGSASYTGGVSVTQNYNASGSTAFTLPSSLEKVTVTKNAIPAYAFHNANTVKEVDVTAVIGDTVPAFAFYGCSSLKGMTLPATVASIEASAFASCTALRTFDFAALTALNYIGDNAFSGCTSLGYADKTLTLALVGTDAYVGENAFKGCSLIENLVVSGTVSVKKGAFSSMSALKSATLTSVDFAYGSFSGWSDMLEVTATGCTAMGGDYKLAFIGGITQEEIDNDPSFAGTRKANIKFN